MHNQLSTTTNPFRKIPTVASHPRNDSQPSLVEPDVSIKSLNYTRKSSRDLLNKAIFKEPAEKSIKLVLQQPKPKQPVIQVQRSKRNSTGRGSKQLNRVIRAIGTQPLANVNAQSHNKSGTRELFCQKAKDISKKMNEEIQHQSHATVDFLLKQFNELCSKDLMKPSDTVTKAKFEEMIQKLSGISYVNVTKPIWSQIFEQRDVNCLSVLSFLLALFRKSVEQYKLFAEKPTFMSRDREESVASEKRKILIKKSTSKPKTGQHKQNHERLGQYSIEKNCIMFSAAERQQIHLRYNYLRAQIQNRIKEKHGVEKGQKDKQNCGEEKGGQITLKVHLNSGLSSMKINKHQNPAEIARKFANQEKLDRLLEHKLCFFLAKQLKNV